MFNDPGQFLMSLFDEKTQRHLRRQQHLYLAGQGIKLALVLLLLATACKVWLY